MMLVHVDWLIDAQGPLLRTAGRVALSSCPGRPDLGSDVARDVAHLAGLGIRNVVSLVGDEEMEVYGVVGLRQALHAANIRSLHFPIEDRHPPTDIAATQSLIETMLGLLERGEHTLIHCIGGWGRSGTVAASLLTHQGYEAERAIELVRRARSPRCVESRAQERFVQDYARRLALTQKR